MALNHTPSAAARRRANAARKLEDWVEALLRQEHLRKADLFRRGLSREVPRPVDRPNFRGVA